MEGPRFRFPLYPGPGPAESRLGVPGENRVAVTRIPDCGVGRPGDRESSEHDDAAESESGPCPSGLPDSDGGCPGPGSIITLLEVTPRRAAGPCEARLHPSQRPNLKAPTEASMRISLEPDSVLTKPDSGPLTQSRVEIPGPRRLPTGGRRSTSSSSSRLVAQ